MTIPDIHALRRNGVELTGERLIVRTMTRQDAVDLVDLMLTDEVMRDATGMPLSGKESAEWLLESNEAWARDRNAVCMAIAFPDGPAFGSISLSHIDRGDCTGRIGYWLASEHWRRGYATEAFGLVVDFARRLGLRSVSANIESHNIASIRLWRRLGAREEVNNDRVRVTLDLITAVKEETSTV